MSGQQTSNVEDGKFIPYMNIHQLKTNYNETICF